MRDIKELQVWKEDCLTSISIDGMDEFDEELFLLNKKCENINESFLNSEDWIDPETDYQLCKLALESEDLAFND